MAQGNGVILYSGDLQNPTFKDASLPRHRHPRSFHKDGSKRRFIMAACFIVSLLLITAVIVGPTLAFLTSGSSNRPLKVAAFNIQHFGRSKMSDTTVANHITEILVRYDVILIQEVRDSTGSSLKDLWSRLNKTDDWGFVASAPIGRTTYKEQYVFYYRLKLAHLLSTYQTPDSSDVYEREPFSVEFEYFSVTPGTKKQVVLMALHSRPTDAFDELDHLPTSIKSAASHFKGAGGVVAMGDFNADCNYVSSTKQLQLEIFKDNSEFTSLIPDSADTTSGDSNCAYDRIIVFGHDIRARDAKVYNYQKAMGLSDDATGDISDHYPVEFQLH
ncbi:deoxyribonuclease-1 [Aplysia californica]|uniref:Deoxyribonuclease-1 n=1 Tax=Aplysia californica TaxID=6500 RepID=A0ABM0JMD8_APLCA|nr:deoxyribonuclease-1 [Aplysia californica]